MGAADYRPLVPRTPPEGLREWMLKTCRSELDLHGLVYEVEYVEDYGLLQMLDEWAKPRKIKMVRVTCSCCGESTLLNWAMDDKHGYPPHWGLVYWRRKNKRNVVYVTINNGASICAEALMAAGCRAANCQGGYGSEFDSLLGQAYSDAVKTAEAPRYLRECLLINPYITAVRDVAVSFAAGRLTVEGTAATVYGEVNFNAVV